MYSQGYGFNGKSLLQLQAKRDICFFVVFLMALKCLLDVWCNYGLTIIRIQIYVVWDKGCNHCKSTEYVYVDQGLSHTLGCILTEKNIMWPRGPQKAVPFLTVRSGLSHSARDTVFSFITDVCSLDLIGSPWGCSTGVVNTCARLSWWYTRNV